MFFNKITVASIALCALQTTDAESIFDIASNAEGFSTLALALNAAGLDGALSGDGTFTAFAPIDSAFADLPEELVNKLLDPIWKPQLQDVLLYHVLGSEVRSTDLSDGLAATTLNGEDITINTDPPRINGNSNILVDDGLVDIEADNGVVHGIGSVLTPVSVTSNIVAIAAGDDRFSTLVAAVTAAGLGDALSGDGPLTVFAPTNAAFDALPEGTVESLLLPENIETLTDILKYHVVAANAASSTLVSGDVGTLNGDTVKVDVSDGGVKVNNANVTIADIIASNGIIHAIDSVLIPPAEVVDEVIDDEPTESDNEKPYVLFKPKSAKAFAKTTKASKSSKSKAFKSSKSTERIFN